MLKRELQTSRMHVECQWFQDQRNFGQKVDITLAVPSYISSNWQSVIPVDTTNVQNNCTCCISVGASQLASSGCLSVVTVNKQHPIATNYTCLSVHPQSTCILLLTCWMCCYSNGPWHTVGRDLQRLMVCEYWWSAETDGLWILMVCRDWWLAKTDWLQILIKETKCLKGSTLHFCSIHTVMRQADCSAALPPVASCQCCCVSIIVCTPPSAWQAKAALEATVEPVVSLLCTVSAHSWDINGNKVWVWHQSCPGLADIEHCMNNKLLAKEMTSLLFSWY